VWGQHFFHLLPYLDQSNLYDASLGSVPFSTGPLTIYWPGNNTVYSHPVSTFLCPSDPSVGPGGVVTVNGVSWGASCYASNSQVFSPIPGNPQGKTKMADIADGTSQTIFYAEKYARCTSSTLGLNGGSFWAYCAFRDVELPPPMERPGKPYAAAFAIVGYFGNPQGPDRSRFQVQPREGECDPTRAATAHPGGMVVCLGDASARILAPNISGDIWWALLTPAGGEVVDRF
jgi:Protein of unknown function (DUF1559)